jgi:hypothetical protein
MSNELNNICEIKTEKESMNFSIKDSFNKKHALKLPSLSNDKRSSTTFNTNNFNEIIYNDSSFYTNNNNNNVNEKTIPEIEEENVETEKNYDSTIKKSMPDILTQRVYSNFTLSSIRQSENTFFNDNNGDDKDLKLNLIQRNNTFRKEYKFLPFIIEMPVLFKKNNKKKNSKKEFKEYHLCSIQNQLYILKKIDGKSFNINNKNKNNKIYIKHSSLVNTEEEIYTDFEILYFNNDRNLISLLSRNFDIYNPILFLDFNLVTADFKINKNLYEIYLSVLSLENFTFTLKLEHKCQNLFKSLVIHLQRSILSSYGYYNNIFGCSLRKNFYKSYFIKFNDFENIAKTGDILLFKGFEKKAKFQRFFTKSEFDHIAILIRINNILYLYDATYEMGCKLKTFHEFYSNFCFLAFDKIEYRRLFINNDSENINEQLNNEIQKNIQIKAEEFIKLTEKKKYDINLKAILCGSEIKNYQKKNKWNIKKGFCCSSLVYSAYLHMGIIDCCKNVNEILPGHFSSKTNMKLNERFILLPELIIDFSN